MPAARLVERLVVRFAEQYGKAHGLVVAQGPDSGVQRQRGITAAPDIVAGRHATDAADLNRASVPGGGTEKYPDMADETGRGRVLRRVDQHAQIGMSPFDAAPG